MYVLPFIRLLFVIIYVQVFKAATFRNNGNSNFEIGMTRRVETVIPCQNWDWDSM